MELAHKQWIREEGKQQVIKGEDNTIRDKTRRLRGSCQKPVTLSAVNGMSFFFLVHITFDIPNPGALSTEDERDEKSMSYNGGHLSDEELSSEGFEPCYTTQLWVDLPGKRPLSLTNKFTGLHCCISKRIVHASKVVLCLLTPWFYNYKTITFFCVPAWRVFFFVRLTNLFQIS